MSTYLPIDLQVVLANTLLDSGSFVKSSRPLDNYKAWIDEKDEIFGKRKNNPWHHRYKESEWLDVFRVVTATTFAKYDEDRCIFKQTGLTDDLVHNI